MCGTPPKIATLTTANRSTSAQPLPLMSKSLLVHDSPAKFQAQYLRVPACQQVSYLEQCVSEKVWQKMAANKEQEPALY